jgi:hypothetical protein
MKRQGIDQESVDTLEGSEDASGMQNVHLKVGMLKRKRLTVHS